MRFSSAVTLLSFALNPFAQAAPATESHGRVHAKSPSGSTDYQSSVFYVNWAIYGRQHFVTDLPAEKFTKVNYAFANVNNVTGEVYLSDMWADVQFPYPGDVATNGSQLLGNFNQFYKLKQKNRNLKVILSVGGWTYRFNFRPALSTADGRKKFCDSSLTLMTDLGLDGFDIDWEYPDGETDAANLIDTVQRCRKLYDEYAEKYLDGYHFELTISAPAGPQHYTQLPIAAVDPYVDSWNIMAFDYQGPGFSNFTGHLSNVYPSKKNPKSTDGWDSENQKTVPFNTKEAIDYYKANVGDSCKIQLGMPLYGRSFANVVDMSWGAGAMGQKFNGSGEGTWEAGVLDYKVLPQNGSKLFYDKEVLASWTWDPTKKQVVSFDMPEVQVWKTEYLKNEGLGGAWWWDSSSDRPSSDPKSMISAVVNALGGSESLRKSTNNLYYPTSKYYNIRGTASNSTVGQYR